MTLSINCKDALDKEFLGIQALFYMRVRRQKIDNCDTATKKHTFLILSYHFMILRNVFK